MNLKEILAISGHGGLFRYISQGRSGYILEQLADKKRIHQPVTAKISGLEDIAVFTHEAEVPLKEVFQKISERENGEKAPSHKSDNETLKNYFSSVLPSYDQNRVYVSDIRKILLWYNILQEQGLLSVESDSTEEPERTK